MGVFLGVFTQKVECSSLACIFYYRNMNCLIKIEIMFKCEHNMELWVLMEEHW